MFSWTLGVFIFCIYGVVLGSISPKVSHICKCKQAALTCILDHLQGCEYSGQSQHIMTMLPPEQRTWILTAHCIKKKFPKERIPLSNENPLDGKWPLALFVKTCRNWALESWHKNYTLHTTVAMSSKMCFISYTSLISSTRTHETSTLLL